MNSRGCFQPFFECGRLIWGQRYWSHLVEVVLVLMLIISLGQRDMVNVGGAVISHVGIFVIVL